MFNMCRLVKLYACELQPMIRIRGITIVIRGYYITCNTITLLPPLRRLRPRSPKIINAILCMRKMCSRFPGSIVIRITNPLDKVFLAVVSLAVVEDAFDFIFSDIVNGDGVWRRDWRRPMVDGVRSDIRS